MALKVSSLPDTLINRLSNYTLDVTVAGSTPRDRIEMRIHCHVERSLS